MLIVGERYGTTDLSAFKCDACGKKTDPRARIPYGWTGGFVWSESGRPGRLWHHCQQCKNVPAPTEKAEVA